jgi:hypothetical protein
VVAGCVSGLRAAAAARKPDYTDNLKTKHQRRQTTTTSIKHSSS